MSPGQILPGQMSQLQLKKNLVHTKFCSEKIKAPKKLGQNFFVKIGSGTSELFMI